MAVNPAIMHERSEEQKRMQLQPPALGEQVIRSVRVFFDNGKRASASSFALSSNLHCLTVRLHSPPRR